MKDNLGKTIKEGDVVELQATFLGTGRSKIVFHNGELWPDGYQSHDNPLTNPCWTKKVLGSFYENPELLA